MKTLKDLLLLGDPGLYRVSEPVTETDLSLVPGWVADLHNVMCEIRLKYHFGRAIAAPQLGILKRLIYMNIDEPVIIINPRLSDLSPEMMEVWDDCMSFPNLLVSVNRHKSLTVNFVNENWQAQEWKVNDNLAALLQHESDHLDGILCTMRAVDNKSFKWRNLQ
jgi:peptide deformylase